MVPSQPADRHPSELPRELEIKVDLSPEQLDRLEAHPQLPEVTVGQPATRMLRTIYFDTPDQRLHQAGVSLRVRSDGESWLQTVKSNTEVRNGLSNPIEVEIAIAGPEPDLKAITHDKLRRTLVRLARKSVLEPVFETIVNRTTRMLQSHGGQIELAFDKGVVKTGTSEELICEVELELKSGPPSSLLETATDLLRDAPCRLSELSKADRGYNLVSGRAAATALPQHSTPVNLDPAMSSRAALGLLFHSAESQIRGSRLVMLQSDDPKGPHQLRVGLRRLRSLLRALKPLVGADAVRDLSHQARTVASSVGELRDADVLIDTIYAAVAGSGQVPDGLAELREQLEQHRLACRRRARAVVDGPQWSSLQLYLALWLPTIEATPALDERIDKVVRKALDRSWNKARRAGKKFEHLDAEQRHELRLALKSHRYMIEQFSSLFNGRQLQCYMKKLKNMLDVVGYMNDVRMANRFRSTGVKEAAADSESDYAAGYVLGWHTAHASSQLRVAKKLWTDLNHADQFWC